MKCSLAFLSALFYAVTASPIAHQVLTRQDGSSTSNDLIDGICRRVTFIFARGSAEPGNMGDSVGPQTCLALQARLGTDQVACQGVGFPYVASLAANFLPQNTDRAAIGEATDMFELADTQCPETSIVSGGYSQGTAVIDGSIQTLSSELQDKIKGVVLYGFTRNLQDGGRIPGYPVERTKVFCAEGDLVCKGTLILTEAHFTYAEDVDAAAEFLVGLV